MKHPLNLNRTNKAMIDLAIIERLLAVDMTFIHLPHYSKRIDVDINREKEIGSWLICNV